MIFHCLCLANSSSFSSQLKPPFLVWPSVIPRLELFPCNSSSLLFLTSVTHIVILCSFSSEGDGPYLFFQHLLYVDAHYLFVGSTDGQLSPLRGHSHLKRLRWISVVFGEDSWSDQLSQLYSRPLGNHFPFFQSFSPCLLLPLEIVGDFGRKKERRTTQSDSSLVLNLKEHEEPSWLTIGLVITWQEDLIWFGTKTVLG